MENTYRGSADMVRRLDLHAEHEWHDGCVNTVCWSTDGEKLISGEHISSPQREREGKERKRRSAIRWGKRRKVKRERERERERE